MSHTRVIHASIIFQPHILFMYAIGPQFQRIRYQQADKQKTYTLRTISFFSALCSVPHTIHLRVSQKRCCTVFLSAMDGFVFMKLRIWLYRTGLGWKFSLFLPTTHFFLTIAPSIRYGFGLPYWMEKENWLRITHFFFFFLPMTFLLQDLGHALTIFLMHYVLYASRPSDT